MEECNGPPRLPPPGRIKSQSTGIHLVRQADGIWVPARHSKRARIFPPPLLPTVRTRILESTGSHPHQAAAHASKAPYRPLMIRRDGSMPHLRSHSHPQNRMGIAPNQRAGSKLDPSIDSRLPNTIRHPIVPAMDTPRLESNMSSFGGLDLLCSATLDLGPLKESPGCSCPKSKCIALYCECFKAGRRCNPTVCACKDCKNTEKESGESGARTQAIQSLLQRNPRAFKDPDPPQPEKPKGEVACSCLRSRCLLLYCSCFQGGKTCGNSCSCVSCENVTGNEHRSQAITLTLEKRPDAFRAKKIKEIGSGCACKNNRCIRKYCECFRTKLQCTRRCSCVGCQNQEDE